MTIMIQLLKKVTMKNFPIPKQPSRDTRQVVEEIGKD
jgi:hypothetical protein